MDTEQLIIAKEILTNIGGIVFGCIFVIQTLKTYRRKIVSDNLKEVTNNILRKIK